MPLPLQNELTEGEALGSLRHEEFETESRFGAHGFYAALFTNPLNPTYKVFVTNAGQGGGFSKVNYRIRYSLI